MADNTVFDSVFKTMLHKAPKLIVPFINEVFGRNYPDDAPVVQFSSEHAGLRGSIIDDSVFRVGEKIYHIECQSTPDANMVVRMIEYDFSIALEQALAGGPPFRLEFPASCVLFLRHTHSTPDVLHMEVRLPDGDSFEYKVKVVKAQAYSKDDLFDRKLLLLLPYYFMRYERELSKIARDDERTWALLAECSDLRLRLEAAMLRADDTVLYEELVELIIRVSDHILEAHKALQGKVRGAMGGEVLELVHERAAREGRAEGRAEGHDEMLRIVAEQLAELGVSEDVIEMATAAARDRLDETSGAPKNE